MQSFSMEMHFNATLQSVVDAVTYDYNGTGNRSDNNQSSIKICGIEQRIIICSILVICCMGFWGNGTVIWLLGFRIRRNPFTTYILNLAVADFAVLLSLEFAIFMRLYDFGVFSDIPYSIAFGLLDFTYNAGQLLLTAISIDRCVSVLFPIWHRCVRPTLLSTTVCALIWVISCLLCVNFNILGRIDILPNWVLQAGQYFLTGLFCLPLVTISTVILFIKVWFKSHPRKRGRLLTVILLTLLFFLVFAFPFSAILFVKYIVNYDISFQFYYGFLFASLNSSVNPFLYFLVGRKKGGRSRESLMVILQRVLNEEENVRQEVDLPCLNPLRNLS